jgi:hypothetical protein
MQFNVGCSELYTPLGAAAAAGASTKDPYALGSVVTKQTTPADWQRGRSSALVKHNVTCGDGYLLKGWRLVWPTNTQLFIKYECIRVAVGAGQLKCEWNETLHSLTVVGW